MRIIIDDKHIIKWMWAKKIPRKMLARHILTEGEVLMGYKNTDQNILTLLIFVCCEVALCGRPPLEHKWVMPLLSLSPLNV